MVKLNISNIHDLETLAAYKKQMQDEFEYANVLFEQARIRIEAEEKQRNEELALKNQLVRELKGWFVLGKDMSTVTVEQAFKDCKELGIQDVRDYAYRLAKYAEEIIYLNDQNL